jgi:hypothetical protein
MLGPLKTVLLRMIIRYSLKELIGIVCFRCETLQNNEKEARRKLHNSEKKCEENRCDEK